MFTWQDSYTPIDETKVSYKAQGFNQKISYAEYITDWRAFDYVFILVYPADRKADLDNVLGPWADQTWSIQHALDIANQEIPTLSGMDLFFAWFNKGTSLVYLGQGGDASTAYDYALQTLYPTLSNDQNKRPYRILWYQTGAYKAYFSTSQFDKVITLADNVLSTIVKPRSLEESWYWKAQAEYALGQYDKAYADIKQAYYYNKNLQATIETMQAWGVTP
jgi:tetratricopeptide (TPR) repeat protein